MNREFQIYRWSDTATEEEAVSGLAEALGMNYDHDLHVMYMGDDKDNGFCVAGINGDVTNNMVVKGWCNGAVTNNNGWATISSGDNQRSIAYIINDDETAGAFGPSISEMRCTFSKATHTEKDEMIGKLEKMMRKAGSEEERMDISECIEKLERM